MKLRRTPALAFAAACHSSPAAADEWRWSFEGHGRTMYEKYRGLDLGLGPVDNDDWFHQRVQGMATLDRGETFRLASEFTWGRIRGKESQLAPPDQDDLDFLQLYAEATLPLGADILEAPRPAFATNSETSVGPRS
jgi:hypothetical protein